MTDRILALLAIVVLAGYLGILAFGVGRIDLGIVAAVTFVLVIWDFVTTKSTPLRRR